MVIKNQDPQSYNGFALKLAPVTDRLLAFLIDLLLLSPAFQLLLSPLTKKIQTLMVVSPDATELNALLLVAAGSVAALLVICQTVCWSVWGATPGKYFLKLRVVSVRSPNETRLTWSQSLVRSLTWCLEIPMLGIPLLEIISHAHRRPLHDRAGESMVVTLKVKADAGPHPIESHFIRQTMVIIGAVAFCWAFFSMNHVYRMAVQGSFKKEEMLDENYLCQKVSEDSENRVDEALALFLAGEVNDECVEREADFALWSLSAESKSWAYLARGMISKDQAEMSREYLDKACSDKDLMQDEPCRLARNDLKGPSSSLTAKILELERLERQGNYAELKNAVEQFPSPYFKQSLIGFMLRAAWSSHELEKARGIFEAQRFSLENSPKSSLAAWMCLQEMSIGCEQAKSHAACDLVSTASAESRASGQLEVAWAQIKLRDCQKSSEPILEHFSELSSKRPDFKALAQATVLETAWPTDRRAAQLERLAQSSKGLLQSFAVQEWINHLQSEKQLRSLLTVLESQKNHDWKWQNSVMKGFSKAFQMGAYDIGFEISQLISPEKFALWNLEKELITNAFKAKEIAWALATWKKMVPSSETSRLPAASSDWKDVESRLRQMGDGR